MADDEGTSTAGSFFDDLKTWSEIKLRILRKYVDAYIRKRGGFHAEIFYVDGFAGKGHFGQGRNRREGSPLILARFAQEIASTGKGRRLTCINVEFKRKYFLELEQALAAFDPNLVKVRYGAFADHLPDILAESGRKPALFFLDPFGVKAIRLADLNPLLHRPDTELLLNLNTRRLRMMAGFEDSTAKDRDAKLRLVSEVLGDDPSNPKWLAEWYRLSNPVEWEDWAARTYAERLIAESPHLKFSLRYPVRETYSSNPKYHLVFATRAFDGVEIMNDLLCREEDDLFTRTESVTDSGQYSFMPILRESERDNRLTSLPDEIFAYGMRHPGCTRKEIVRHFVLDNFGELKLKHYRQALDALVREGRASFAGKRQNKDEDPISFLPGAVPGR